MQENRTYRIRANVGDVNENVINVKLDQHYDTFEILSLKIDQENFYKTYESDYGVVVGRVLANGGFGVPNAKVSIFIESDENDDIESRIYYPYRSPNSKNADGIRYNLLTDFLDKACYQNVGTFPNKRLVLDNDDVIDIFDKYYRYTTVTNSAGDYMIFGVPTGSQRLHVDVDLSDIGMLSQRPRDMVYKGYNINLFESPNKFKRDTNLNSLAQIKTQDIGLYVYPYWGDTSEDTDNIAVTRADIQLDYKFEPTCVFMGSIITDTGSNAIGKNCTSTENVGKMSELIAGEGSIEMIRKTYDGKIEEFQVRGNRVIDGDGVWCYQIPMNLDYIMTDEFGNIVPSDNPEKGIPTRTRVRFRISLDDAPDDNTARKRCRYLVPNNPRLDEERFPQFVKTKEPDYEFGSRTKDESFKDLLWNKVYTVKNYVPRLQKNRRVTDRKHTGIKLINHYDSNNPMPYNNVDIKLGFTYRLLCVIFKIFINLVQFLNQILTAISLGFCTVYKVFNTIAKAIGRIPIVGGALSWPFRQVRNLFEAMIVPCVGISSDMCGGNTTHNNTFYPGCGNLMFTGKSAGALADCIKDKTRKSHDKKENKKIKDGEIDESERTVALLGGTEELYNCVETALAEDNDTISLNFQNDWVNGTLYAPMWFRKITKKRSYLFGLIKRRAKDQWCEGEKNYTRKKLRVFNPCSPKRPGKVRYTNFDDVTVDAHYMNFSDNKKYKDSCRDKCHESTRAINLDKGLIVKRQTMLGQDVYYYKPVEFGIPQDSQINSSDDFASGESGFDNGSVKILFATDIVLLGSLNDCDLHGVPQFFKSLEPTTFQIPPNILFTDNEITVTMSKGSSNSSNNEDPDNVNVEYDVTEESTSEMTGMDWGNYNEDICGKWSDPQDSGLFYSIGCSTIKMKPKSCINMSRICEFGVSLDETKSFLPEINQGEISGEDSPIDEAIYETIVPDGFISKDELYNDDERSLFATLNINGLMTERNPENGLMEYTFKHVVVNNFDKSLYEYMSERQRKCDAKKTQRFNYALEEFSEGYYDFRMGASPYFYDNDSTKGYKFPRYENSFYFYFGLIPGKTAIDKFNSQFTSDCANPNTVIDPINIEAVGNSWCAEMTEETSDDFGYVAFDLSQVDLPCDIVITSTTNNDFPECVIDGNEDEMFYFSENEQTELDNRGYTWKRDTCGRFKNGTYNVVITDNNGEIIVTSFTMKADPMASYIVSTDFYEPDNILMKKFGNDRNRIASDRNCLSCDDINKTRGIGGTIAILKPYNSRTGEKIEEYRINVYCRNHEEWTFTYLSSGTKVENYIHLLCDEDEFIIIGLPKGDEVYRIEITELCDGYDSGNVFIQDTLVKETSPFKLYVNGVVDYDVIKHWDCGFKVTNATLDDETNGKLNFTTDGQICDKWWHMSNKNNYMWCYYQPYIDADKQLIDLADVYKSAVDGIISDLNPAAGEDETFTAEDKAILNGILSELQNCCLYTYNPANKHFFYTEIPVREYDSAYVCNDSGDGAYSVLNETYSVKETQLASLIDGLTQIIEGLTLQEQDSEAYSVLMAVLSICEDAHELLSSIEPMKDSFVNWTKSAFQLNCSEYDKSLYFMVETKDNPVTYHGAYVLETMDEETDLFTLENGLNPKNSSWVIPYTKEGESVDSLAIPTISYRDSARFGHDDAYNAETRISMPAHLCLATDNATTVSQKPASRLCNFIAVINGRGNTIPNDACIKDDLTPEEACGNSENGFTDKRLTCNYFGYHIIDKIFEAPFMAWAYVNQVPYFKPLKGNFIDENKAGVSMCMNGLLAGKIYNGSATSYTLIDDRCYDTKFVEQSIGANKLKIATVMADNISTVAEMEDEMPTRRYIVGSDNIDGRVYENYRITDPAGKVHESTDNNKIWNVYTDHKQYAQVLNAKMDFVLEDESGCQIVNTIDGRMKVVLGGGSVNLCSNKMKNRRKGSKLNVSLENRGDAEDVLYLVFNLTNERTYPLNLTEKIEVFYTSDVSTSDFTDLVENGLFNEVDGVYVNPDAEEYYYENDFGDEVLITPENVNDLPQDVEIYHKIEEDRLDDADITNPEDFAKVPEVPCRKTKFDCEMSDGGGYSKLFEHDVRYVFSYYNEISDASRFIPLPFISSLANAYRSFGGFFATQRLESKYIQESTDKESKTYGYSNNGEFTFREFSENDYENAYYVIAVTDRNTRAISPVYDFCYLCAKLIFGIVYTRSETVNENGDVDGYEVLRSPKATFDIGNVVKEEPVNGNVKPEKIKYYFYYYPYSINFECKLDETNTIEGSYTHTAYKDNRDGYVLFDIDDASYDSLFKIYKGSNGKVGKNISKNTTIEAYDVTGLKHLPDWIGCKKSGGSWKTGFIPCDDEPEAGCVAYERKVWVTVTWNPNCGVWKKSNPCGDKYIDIDDEGNVCDESTNGYYGESATYTKIFTLGSGQSYDVFGAGEVELNGRTFLGWATSYDATTPEFNAPTTISLDVDLSDENAAMSLSVIYYAIWSGSGAKVMWLDCFGERIGDIIEVVPGTIISDIEMSSKRPPTTGDTAFKRWNAMVGTLVNGELDMSSLRPAVDGEAMEENGSYVIYGGGECVQIDENSVIVFQADCMTDQGPFNLTIVNYNDWYTLASNCTALEHDYPIMAAFCVEIVRPDSDIVEELLIMKQVNLPSARGGSSISQVSITLSDLGGVFDRLTIQLIALFNRAGYDKFMLIQNPDCDDATGHEDNFIGENQDTNCNHTTPNPLMITCDTYDCERNYTIYLPGAIDCSKTIMVYWIDEFNGTTYEYARRSYCKGEEIVYNGKTPDRNDTDIYGSSATPEYTFNGWDRNDEYAGEIDITFRAQWSRTVLSYKFIVNGRQIGTLHLAAYGTQLDESDFPTVSEITPYLRSGDEYNGLWEKTTDDPSDMPSTVDVNSSGFSTTITKNTTFTAILTDEEPSTNTYTVRFFVKGTQVGSDITVNENDTVGDNVPDDSTVESMLSEYDTFDGEWNLRGTSMDYSSSYIQNTLKITANTDFDAKITTITPPPPVTEYVVEFDYNLPQEVEGKDKYGNVVTNPPAQSVAEGGHAVAPSIPELNEWNFKNWELVGDSTKFPYSSSDVEAIYVEHDMAFIAIWNGLHHIPYYIHNNTQHEFYSISVKIRVVYPGGSEVYDTDMGGGLISAGGYHYHTDFHSDAFPNNWTYITYESCVVTISEVGTVTIDQWNVSHSYKTDGTGTYKLYVENPYYYPDGGSANPDGAFHIYVDEVDEPTPPPVPTYSVIFRVLGDGANATIRTVNGLSGETAVNTLQIPTETEILNATGNSSAYRFIDWDSDPYTAVVSQGTTFIAQVEKKRYSVAFRWNDPNNTIVTRTNIKHGEYVEDVPTASSAPQYANHTFSEWTPDPSLTPITSNGMYFDGVWTEDTIETCNIIFRVVNTYDESILYTFPTVPVEKNTVIPSSSIPTEQQILQATGNQNAFTFDGWTKKGGGAVDFTQPVTANATYNALVTKKAYTVTFDHNNGTGNTTVVSGVEYGDSVQMASAPTREGYSFDGWRYGSRIYLVSDSYQNVTSDMTFVAQWSLLPPNTHTVTFVFGLNQPNVVQTVVHGETAQEPTKPTISGYQFYQWDGDITQPIVADTTFTAKWKVKVEFTANGGTISGTAVQWLIMGTDTPIVPSVTADSGKLFKDKWTISGHTTQYDSSTIAGWTFTEPHTFVAVIVDVYTVEFYVYNSGTETRIGGTHTVESGNTVTPPNDTAISNAISGTNMARFSQSTPWRISNANGTFNTNGDTYATSWFSNGITSNMKFFLRTAYNVTFDFDQPTLENVIQAVEQGHPASVPVPGAVENCTFTGNWSSNVSGMTTSSAITEQVTFTALWDCQEPQPSHTVTWLKCDGTKLRDDSITGDSFVYSSTTDPSLPSAADVRTTGCLYTGKFSSNVLGKTVTDPITCDITFEAICSCAGMTYTPTVYIVNNTGLTAAPIHVQSYTYELQGESSETLSTQTVIVDRNVANGNSINVSPTVNNYISFGIIELKFNIQNNQYTIVGNQGFDEETGTFTYEQKLSSNPDTGESIPYMSFYDLQTNNRTMYVHIKRVAMLNLSNNGETPEDGE